MIVHPGSSTHYGVAITPHATTENILYARFLQNVGTAGSFVVRQDTGSGRAAAKAPSTGATVTVYLAQGQTIECASSWVGVNAVGLGAGVSLVGYW